jgi:hypothetical protein
MPKKLLATTMIIVLAIEILLPIAIVSGNFTPMPAVSIASPRDRYIYPWITYDKAYVPLEIRVVVPKSCLPIPRVLYSIDGEANITLTNITDTHPYWGDDFYQVSMNSSLTNLREGNHTLSAYSFNGKGETLSYTRNFAVGNSTFYSEPIQTTPYIPPFPRSSWDFFWQQTFLQFLVVVMGFLFVTALIIVIAVYFRRREKP